MNLNRYWKADRWHSHTVVFTHDGEEEAMTVDCPPDGFLCRSTRENRVSVSFVSAIGAASPAHLSWYERLHRAFMFSRFAPKRLPR